MWWPPQELLLPSWPSCQMSTLSIIPLLLLALLLDWHTHVHGRARARARVRAPALAHARVHVVIFMGWAYPEGKEVTSLVASGF